VTVQERTVPTVFLAVIAEGQAKRRVDLSDKLLSFTYEDAEHKADKVTVTVDNWDLAAFDDPTWKKGNLLEVSWGYPGAMSPTRQVVIQKITGAQVLTIEGQGTSVLMNKVVRCRTFENVRRSDVVRQIAQANGYGPSQQDIEDTGHVLPAISQARMTDAQLVRRLAAREGFEFYVDFDGFHFHRRRFGQRPTRALRWYTPPEVGEVLSFNIENDVTAMPGAVTVRGRDPLAKRDIDERGSNATTPRDSLAPVIEIVDPETGATRLERRNISEDLRPTAEPSSATAKREADARYRQTQHLTVQLSATVIGDPTLLAKSVIELQGISQRLSGKYYVTEAKHKIDGTGYTIDLKTLRDGHAELGGPPSKGKQNAGSAADNDPDVLRPIEVVDPETGRTHIEYRPTHGRSAGGES
jgi:phage protein D